MVLVAAAAVWLLLGRGVGKDQLDAIRTGGTLGVGLGGVVALWLAVRKQRSTELDLLQKYGTHELAQQVAQDAREDVIARRITDLYRQGVDQLGSDKAPVRLGGLYALERLAQDNPDPQLRQTTVNVLCAYLRMPHTEPPAGVRKSRPLGRRRPVRIGKALPPLPQPIEATSSSRGVDVSSRQESEVRLTAQRILEIHLAPGSKRDSPAPTFWPDINLDLTGAVLSGLNLAHCRLNNARFDKATFRGDAGFEDAAFAGNAWFEGARFTGDAWFERVKFTMDAGFGRAEFEGNAGFGDVHFTGYSRFGDAKFAGNAGFERTKFTMDAVFGGAEFDGDAGFVDAKFAADVGFEHAEFVGDAEFGGAEFAGNVGFERAEFTRRAGFGGTSFTGDARFGRTGFGGNTKFEGAKFAGDAWFGQAEFPGDVQFERAGFLGAAWFGGAKFEGSSRFGRAKFVGQARFEGVEFAKDVEFEEAEFARDAKFGGVVFRGNAGFGDAKFVGDASFGSVEFTGNAAFEGVEFTGNARFESAEFTADVQFGSARFLGDVKFERAWVTTARDDELSRSWPAGWAPDNSQPVSQDGRPGLWVPLAAVLSTPAQANTDERRNHQPFHP